MILVKGSKQWNCGRPVYLSRKEAGAGSFLEPPYSKTHHWGAVAGYNHGNGFQEYCSVEYYLNADYVPESAKKQIRYILGKEEKPSLESPEIQEWIYQVMGYFKNCYQGENGSWNASDLKIKKSDETALNQGLVPDEKQYAIENQDKHAGVHFIRKYYPEFKLERKHLENAYWGTKPVKA